MSKSRTNCNESKKLGVPLCAGCNSVVSIRDKITYGSFCEDCWSSTAYECYRNGDRRLCNQVKVASKVKKTLDLDNNLKEVS